MRRQRTASESNEQDDNEINSNDNEVNSTRRRSSDQNTDDDLMIGGWRSNDIETETDDDDDNNTEDTDNSDYDYSDDFNEEDDEGEEEGEEFDIMEQLQSALFGVGGVNQEDMERLRRTIVQHQQGIFRGSATHSSRVSTIIRALPSDPQATDPMLLYSAFTELWELIVLTGEEVEAYEFDSVIDLKPLLGHLLRVIKWDPECQVYGTEFLLYAVRCTRACIQYSPNCARRLVEGGLVPLITQQLFSVEYIDLAEDLIQIIQLLSKNGTHSRACLHSDGIRAVLGFVDFFALPVQINAFNAAAQMAVALTDDTAHLYISDDILALLRSTVRNRMDSDPQTLKLSHWALQTLYNAFQVAPKYVDKLFPADFVTECILNLAEVLPLDSSQIVLKLASISPAVLLQNQPLLLRFLKTVLISASTNESLLENCLKIIIELYCKSAQKSLQDLSQICISSKSSTNGPISVCHLSELSENIHQFYLNSPSISEQKRQLTLLTLLLLDDVNPNKPISLPKTGTISRLIGDLKVPLSLIIGLEWCRVLGENEEFINTAVRQGLITELQNLASSNEIANLRLNEHLKKWLEDRLESMNVTIFSGEETDALFIYIKHISTALINTFNNTAKISTLASSSKQFSSVKEFLEGVNNGGKFTEFEWLGDPKTCLSRVLLDLIQKDPDSVAQIAEKEFEFVVQEVYKALNRYETVFTANLPSIRLPRSTNPMDSLALLSRPMRVRMHLPDSSQKMVICDPFSNVSWLVKMSVAGDEERRTILRETTNAASSGGGENVDTRIQDALSDASGPNVNFSSKAFETAEFKKSVYLSHKNAKIALEPSASLIEVLFKYVLSASNSEPWKHINDIWSENVVILIEESSYDKNDAMDVTENLTDDEGDDRVKLALDLLNLIPRKVPNDQLSSKLSKELDSPLLVAVNGISSHWIRSVQMYPFLFPFSLRVTFMKTVCLGRLRSLWLLQQRLAPAGGDLVNDLITSTITIPRKRFLIHRSKFLQCLRHVFTPVNCGDLRMFEFEYADELGTGHGPTMEFYALASTEMCRPSLGLFHMTRPGNLEVDEMVEAEGEGLFPSWTNEPKCEEFRILGALVARAWLDDRIIDIPLHPLFISELSRDSNRSLTIEDLKHIDPDLYGILIDESKMIGCGVGFNVPGTEISLLPCDRVISAIEDLKEFQRLLIDRINNNLIQARDSFLQGFNETFPQDFDKLASFFPGDLCYLFTPSLQTETDWTFESVMAAFVPDHGYRPDSPQIRWLAELLMEYAREPRQRSKIIRFLTGAAYLPVGGWKSLRPPLTIVCKTFEGGSSSSPSISNPVGNNTGITINENTGITVNNNTGITTPISSNTTIIANNPSSTDSTSSENHDLYLPSVMTCANYLKLPRYTSKDVMRERFEYAIKEGSGSFYLS